MMRGVDLNWPPGDDEGPLPDLNEALDEAATEDEQQEVEVDVHEGGSQHFSPLCLNQPEQDNNMHLGKKCH